MRRCAQKGCRNEAQPNMFSCAECVPLNPLTLEEKEGEFKIEFESPLKDRLDLLKEFVDQNSGELGLDRTHLLNCLHELDHMHISKLAPKVVRKKGNVTWTLCLTINRKKDFEGKGPTFEEALLDTLENIEKFFVQATAS